MRANTQASLLIAALAVGCADETGPLTQDAGPLP